jgi:hypothetical protein
VSPELTTLLAGAPILAGGVLAAWLLRNAWSKRGPGRPWMIAGGWAVLTIVSLMAGLALGEARGPFIAWTLISAAALGVVAWGVQVRTTRARAEKSLAPEPSERQSRAWRGWLRALLAGPVGMIAAMGVAVAFAVCAPLVPQTRIVIGGLMVPVLWGGAMAWTLADDRILRATAVLVGVSVVTFAAAVLKGF